MEGYAPEVEKTRGEIGLSGSFVKILSLGSGSSYHGEARDRQNIDKTVHGIVTSVSHCLFVF